MLSRKKAKNRSAKKQEMSVEENAQKSAERWLRYAPTFQLPDTQLSELQLRPKNAVKGIAAANAIIQQMKGLKSDACSMRLVDNEGETMVCVFSHRLPALPEGKKEDNPEGQPTVSSVCFFQHHCAGILLRAL